MRVRDQELVDEVQQLRRLGFSHREVAKELNARGWRTQLGSRWTRDSVRRIHDGRPAAAERMPTHSRVPYGFRSDGRRIVACEDEQTILDTAVQLYQEGRTYTQIAASLSERGLLNRAGTVWSPAAVTALLHRHLAVTGRPRAGSPVAYGWQRGADGALEECEEEQKIVRLVRSLRVDSQRGYRGIARVLNAYGYTTRRGSDWTVTSVSRLCYRLRLQTSAWTSDAWLLQCRDAGMSYGATARWLNARLILTPRERMWTRDNVARRCRELGAGGRL